MYDNILMYGLNSNSKVDNNKIMYCRPNGKQVVSIADKSTFFTKNVLHNVQMTFTLNDS